MSFGCSVTYFKYLGSVIFTKCFSLSLEDVLMLGAMRIAELEVCWLVELSFGIGAFNLGVFVFSFCDFGRGFSG